MYVKDMGGFGITAAEADADRLFVDQALPSTTKAVGRFGPVVGRYSLVQPQRIMWETPGASPMSVEGFGQPSADAVAAMGVGAFALWALGLVVIGGVVIWVVKSIKKS